MATLKTATAVSGLKTLAATTAATPHRDIHPHEHTPNKTDLPGRQLGLVQDYNRAVRELELGHHQPIRLVVLSAMSRKRRRRQADVRTRTNKILEQGGSSPCLDIYYPA